VRKSGDDVIAMTMEIKDGVKAFHAKTRKAWRNWLEKNHAKAKGIWLIIYHRKSKTASVYNSDAVEEALCFGWIDSIKKKRDAESAFQFFSPRKPKSTWSKINRDRIEKLTEQGLIAPQGQAMIDHAKKTGTWTAMVEVQQMIIPPDLKKLFDKNAKAFKNFQAFPPSSKQIILAWILNAKKPDTRTKRIKETVALAKQNIRANHYSR
jgi:uncharacterized protein YdeI (YjbR/CyaY-like superfamily)